MKTNNQIQDRANKLRAHGFNYEADALFKCIGKPLYVVQSFLELAQENKEISLVKEIDWVIRESITEPEDIYENEKTREWLHLNKRTKTGEIIGKEDGHHG